MPKQVFEANYDLSDAGYCVAFNCRRAARAVTKLFDLALQASGVRSTQLAILLAVAKSQPMSIGDLSAQLSIDSTTLTRSLGLMHREGLLTVSDRSTMRQRFVTLTHAGRRTLERSVPLWRKAQDLFLSQFGEKRWKALHGDLAQLSAIALRLEKKGRTTFSRSRTP